MSGAIAILLVEDEPLILMDLEMAAIEQGCCALLAADVGEALAHIAACDPLPDVAVLDVSLQNGETSMPVALELKRRGIPFILHSGDFDRTDIQMDTLTAELVRKPASSRLVVETALECLSGPEQDLRAAGA
jgi:DNA-binding response OmpR family regulator